MDWVEGRKSRYNGRKHLLHDSSWRSWLEWLPFDGNKYSKGEKYFFLYFYTRNPLSGPHKIWPGQGFLHDRPGIGSKRFLPNFIKQKVAWAQLISLNYLSVIIFFSNCDFRRPQPGSDIVIKTVRAVCLKVSMVFLTLKDQSHVIQLQEKLQEEPLQRAVQYAQKHSRITSRYWNFFNFIISYLRNC